MDFLNRKEAIALVGIFLLTLLSSFLLMVFVIGPTLIKVGSPESNELIPEAKVVLTKNEDDKEASVNVVLVGYGGEGHSGGGLSDAIILLNIYPETKTAKIVSIPRDLWVNLPGQENKINHAFVEGHNTLKDAIATVTGIRPEYYVAVDFNSFQSAIDALGGVEVNIPVAFDDHFYPIKGLENESCGMSPERIAEVHRLYTGFELEKQFECRYEHLHFESGRQKMDGATALKYVRSRHSGQHGGDFARSERQQSLLLGAMDTLLSVKALDDVPEFYDKMKGFVSTDVDLPTAVALAKLVAKPEDYQLKHVTLTINDVLKDGKSSTGAYILFPKAGLHKWDEVKEYISSN